MDEFLEREYSNLLDRYRELLANIDKNTKRGGLDTQELTRIDTERKRLHQLLRQKAGQIGKSAQDVDVDILMLEGNLKEHLLPEFSITRTDNKKWSENAGLVSMTTNENEDALHPHQDSAKIKYVNPKTDNSKVFIPFGEEDLWHLFDGETFTQRAPDNLERRRRALKAARDNGVYFLEVNDTKTFHRGKTLFGIAFPSEDFDRIVNYLYTHREETSILPEYIDHDLVEKDYAAIVEDDVRIVESYVAKQQHKYPQQMEEYLQKYVAFNLRFQQLDPELRKILEQTTNCRMSEDEIEEVYDGLEPLLGKEPEKVLEGNLPTGGKPNYRK